MPPTDITVPRRHRRVGSVIAALSLCAAAFAGLVGAAGAAQAAPNPQANDPMGWVRSVSSTTSGLSLAGWAADPNQLTANVVVYAVLDGRSVLGQTVTSQRNPTVTSTFRTGATPGWVLSVAVPTGNHVVCVGFRNLGPGMDRIRRCIATPLGRAVSTTESAAHNPVGAITGSWASRTAVRFAGWATDPDIRWRRSVVVLYIDGRPAQTVATFRTPSPRPSPATGVRSWYDIRAGVSVFGAHVGCIWVVNTGLGANSFLGCQTVDSKLPYGRATAYTPPSPMNAAVVAFAKKQIGKPYIWGATGMTGFDCSGLVQRAYASLGFTTPRVSEDQAKAATLIPAAHARPGDLVFWHDSVGDVHHVGIYLSPGMSVAAIDTAHGVDYQQLWDLSVVTYGSFTHT